jgi:hypothetical protein
MKSLRIARGCVTLLPCLGLLSSPAWCGDSPPSPQPAVQLDRGSREAWRKSMSRAPSPRKGCFKASYPSTEWQEVRCATATPYPLVLPHLVHSADHGLAGGGGPDTVGEGANYSAQVSGLMSSAEGSFPSVSGVTSEVSENESNLFTLQLNSNFFATTVCPAASPSCQGWLQFLFGSESYGAAVGMQYWLLNYGQTCPAGWSSSGPSCYANSMSTQVPALTIADLAELSLTGNAVSGGLDTVIVSTGSDLYSASGEDSMLNLAQGWNVAEFNIFGGAGGGEANFNPASTIVVRTSVDDGTMNAPLCVTEPFPGETNNLTLVPPCCPQGGASPAIEFSESNAAGATSACTLNSQAVIWALVPSSATPGGSAFTLTVNGSGFVNGSTVQWNGSAVPTSFENTGQLTASISAGLISAPGSASVTVVTPGAPTSNAIMFTISPPVIISGLVPSSATAGGSAFTLTVNGSGFVNGSTVQWNASAVPTSFVSAGQLTASISAGLISAAGSASVTVVTPGAPTANTVTFTINPPAVITYNYTGNHFTAVSGSTTLTTSNFISGSFALASPLSPNATYSTIAGTITLSGWTMTDQVNTLSSAAGNFLGLTLETDASGSIVAWNATAQTASGCTNPCIFLASETSTAPPYQFTEDLSQFNIPATWFANVMNDPGTWTAALPPVAISGLVPSSATAGGAAFTLTVNGSGFVNSSTVQWNGSAVPTSFVNIVQLTASISAGLIASAGTPSVTVSVNGVTSSPVTFTIIPAAAISGLVPSSATAGGAAFTLTVNGSGFVNGSTVQWNGSAVPTNFVSTGQLTASISAGLIASAGTPSVTVSVNGVTSSPVIFTITAPAVISGLVPSAVTAGGSAFTLTVNGSGFVNGSTVQWNGSAVSTSFVSAGQLTASISAGLIASAGTPSVTVSVNGVTSSPVTFTINAANATAVISGLVPSAATAGGAAFTLTVNGSGFVNGSTVQWNGSAVSTSFVSAGQLTASISAGLIASAGTPSVTVSVNGVTSSPVTFTINAPAPAFFAGEVNLGSGVEYLQFPNNTVFGYYTFLASTIFYHYDMGFEAFVPGSADDVYLYDFTSNHWWYTSTTLFPYLYDFNLNAWIYYFPNTQSPGHYTTNPRYFSNLTTGTTFTM